MCLSFYKRIFNPVFLAAFMGLLGMLASVARADIVENEYLTLETVASVQEIAPGQSFWLGIRLEHAEGWHTYWENPGDSGLPTEVVWASLDGTKFGPIQWPVPERQEFFGLINYGYSDEVMLVLEVTPPADLAPGSTFNATGEVAYLICADICIPRDATVTFSLPVSLDGASDVDPIWAPRITQVRNDLPQMMAFPSARYTIEDQHVTLEITASRPLVDVIRAAQYFPVTQQVADNAVEPRLYWTGEKIFIQTAISGGFETAPAELTNLLVLDTDDGKTSYRFNAQYSTIPIATDLSRAVPYGAELKPGLGGVSGFLIIVLSAFLGGIILNLMPCVFPVLSLKALNIVRKSQEIAGVRQRHGLAYTGGIILSFLVVAGVMLALRGAGESIGWGYQLQSPWFVATLAYILFAMGLSLSGVYEFGMSLMGAGSSIAGKSGYSGSFFNGVLATVVATPCTAPFMATAIGVAVTQPPLVSLVIFAALGLGLAFPILLISYVPGLSRMLPKAGPWMVRLKEFLAFPLYLTTVWLLWVLSRQIGQTELALVACGLVLIAFAMWLARTATGSSKRRVLLASAVVPVVLALFVLTQLNPVTSREAVNNDAGAIDGADLPSEAFSNDRLARARADGQIVFVNMTADWCITCKVNERIALLDDEVISAFETNDVLYLVGDWTLRDAEITNVLESFGRSGVPLYLMYGPGSNEAQVLPQLLTTDILMDALNEAGVSASQTP